MLKLELMCNEELSSSPQLNIPPTKENVSSEYISLSSNQSKRYLAPIAEVRNVTDVSKKVGVNFG